MSVREKVRQQSRAFFFVLLAVAGPASAQGRAPVRSLLEIRQENVVVQQWDVSCGAAALATLLTYHVGEPVSEKAAAQAMLGKTDALRVKVRGGFSLLDLKRYAEARGFEADARNVFDDRRRTFPGILFAPFVKPPGSPARPGTGAVRPR